MSFRTTLITLIIFLCLVAFYFFIPRDNQVEDQNVAEKIGQFYGLNKRLIQKIQVIFPRSQYFDKEAQKDLIQQSYTLVRFSQNNWRLINPIVVDADKRKVDRLLSDLLEKRIKRRIEVTSLLEYGLDDPTVKISLFTQDGSTKTFLIGKKTVNYSIYAKEKLDSKMMLIESSIIRDYSKSPDDLRNLMSHNVSQSKDSRKRVFDFQRAETTQIDILSTDLEIVLRKQPDGNWQMTEPNKSLVDQPMVEDLLFFADALKGTEVQNLKGLPKAKIRVRFYTKEAEPTVLILHHTKDNNEVYAKTRDKETMFRIDDHLLKLIRQIR